MRAPRVMLAAPASGSGKTLITCGLLQALVNRKMKTSAFKCGPDYIDPMFHSKIMGIESKNLDTYFASDEIVRYLFGKTASHTDIAVLEGVMGYYDGIAGISTNGSAYHVANVVESPVILVVDTKGMSLSVTALIKGYLEFRPDSRIAGVILNRMSAALYSRVKEQIESELQIKVFGYVPKTEEYVIASRHLGLITPDEVEHLHETLNGLADMLETTLDVDGIIALAQSAPDITYEEPKLPKLEEPVTIGVAKDEAFCFYYRDNLELLEKMGAKIQFFSPLHDREMPKDLDGLILYGGYPELHGQALSENVTMRSQMKAELEAGLPYLAECGGFMYLHEWLTDPEGQNWPMLGWIHGSVYKRKTFQRFGYIEVTGQKDQILGKKGCSCKAHEFHYYESTTNGDAFLAQKPMVDRNWLCIHGDEQGCAGFPHLYYYSNPEMIYHFLETCKKRKQRTRV